MKIVILNNEQFDNFSQNHPLHTMYQTSSYGNLMQKCGYNVNYYGFIDDSNSLIGATLIIDQTLFGNHKYAYAPRGFLLNYDDRELLKEATYKLKRFLSTKRVVFLKIDPPVINNKRDKEGNIIPSPHSNDIIPFLEKIGYVYFGENKFFGTLKPRWNAILKVTGSSETMFNNIEKNIKNKIRKAQSRGVEILQGNHNDIKLFYSFVAKKHYRNLEYYQNLANCFGNNLELYFAKLNTEAYLKNIKAIYEDEIEINNQLNLEYQKDTNDNKLMNKKIQSDKLLTIYKKELITASNLLEKNPQGIIIAATAIVIQKYSVELLIEGQNPAFSLYYPTFLLKWHIINKYSKLGAVYFDLNAITGYFADNNKFKGLNEMKLGYNADVTEYIGEFDLVINKTMYKIYQTTSLGRNKLKKNAK